MPDINAVTPDMNPSRRLRGLRTVGVAAGVIAVLLVAGGLASRSAAQQELRTWTRDQSVPTVQLAILKTPTTDGALVLPGQVEAFNSAAIHSRVSGYLKRWDVDLGARVKAGQVLAEVDTPDINQDLLKARADLASAMAGLTLARTTEARWAKLLADSAVSRQEYEEKAGDLSARTSLVQAAQANLDSILATKTFARIVAPFDGVITSRNAQLGQLVSASATEPLFTINDDSKLRVYVRVPQVYARQIARGATATLTAPEFAGRSFEATLVNTAESISADSGTLLAELQLGNTDQALKPGSYVQARFQVAATAGVVQAPASALMFRQDGMMLAVVGDDNRVSLRKVVIGRDMGATIEIASGVTLTDRVVDNPSDTLSDGEEVRIFAAGPAA